MCNLDDSTRQYIRGRTKHRNQERINLSGTRCTGSIWTCHPDKSTAALKNRQKGRRTCFSSAWLPAPPRLDFGLVKAQVYGMPTTDRHLPDFFRVCPIAGV
uniref:Membrane dipeptidase n=1 Tax=Aureimonas altamirensis TaxID=370622 RepID=A0A0P0YX07_9HYPH|nr:membrane dipeptidase [Aureimonas altamirensis]